MNLLQCVFIKNKETLKLCDEFTQGYSVGDTSEFLTFYMLFLEERKIARKWRDINERRKEEKTLSQFL